MNEAPVTGRLLWLVAMKWRAAVDRAVAPLGLTHAQYSLLGSLYGLSQAGERPSQRELADYAGLEPIYVSKLVKALEAAGLLERTQHPADTRAMQLTLTDQGAATIRRAVTIVHTLQGELTAPIGGRGSPGDLELARTLQTLLGQPPGPTNDTRDDGSTAMTTPTLTGQDIAEAQGAVRGLLDAVVDGSGSDATEYVILRVITGRGPWADTGSLRDYLAGQPQLSLTSDAATEILHQMAGRGLIDTSGPVVLTEAGTELFARLNAAVQQTTARLYADSDPAELAVAHRVLADITERATTLRTQI